MEFDLDYGLGWIIVLVWHCEPVLPLRGELFGDAETRGSAPAIDSGTNQEVRFLLLRRTKQFVNVALPVTDM